VTAGYKRGPILRAVHAYEDKQALYLPDVEIIDNIVRDIKHREIDIEMAE
jgi:hypothetical protein